MPAALCRFVADHRPPDHIDPGSRVGTMLRAIHGAPFDRMLSASTLKSTCGSRDHNVASEFKLAVGCSIMSYVTMLRLTAAAQCLTLPGVTVMAVAQGVGYASIQRFYVAFVRHVGTTPARFARTRSVQRLLAVADSLGLDDAQRSGVRGVETSYIAQRDSLLAPVVTYVLARGTALTVDDLSSRMRPDNLPPRDIASRALTRALAFLTEEQRARFSERFYHFPE